MSKDAAKQALRDELERGREDLLADPTGRRIVSLIEQALGYRSDDVYVVHWIPEQGEDLYDVLVDGRVVVRVEIPRAPEAWASCVAASVEQFRSGARLSTTARRRLAAALELSAARRRGP